MVDMIWRPKAFPSWNWIVEWLKEIETLGYHAAQQRKCHRRVSALALYLSQTELEPQIADERADITSA
jgi:hypothetical protein